MITWVPCKCKGHLHFADAKVEGKEVAELMHMVLHWLRLSHPLPALAEEAAGNHSQGEIKGDYHAWQSWNLLRFAGTSVSEHSQVWIQEKFQRLLRAALSLHWVICTTPWAFPGGLEGKESTCNAGDAGWIPGLGIFSGEGNDNTLQCSCLGIPMDREAWWATVHGVAKSQTWLSGWHFHFLRVSVMSTCPFPLLWSLFPK